MMYVALAEALGLVVVVVTFASIVRWQMRQAARERDLLVNQLCNLAGRPWQEAPSARVEEREPELLLHSPEQLPDW